MNPDDPRHGTEAGHEQHLRDGENPCAACIDGDLRASRRRSKRKAMGAEYTKPLGNLHAKLVGMRRRGAVHDDIAELAGISPSQAFRICLSGPEYRVYLRTWQRLRDMPAGPIYTTIGATRRIQGLVWLGYSYPLIAAEVGCSRDTIADLALERPAFCNRTIRRRIAEVYARMEVHIPAPDGHREKASATRMRNYARRRGWQSPMVWDDHTIDDPTAKPYQPRSGHDHKRLSEVDEAVVIRVLSGEKIGRAHV